MTLIFLHRKDLLKDLFNACGRCFSITGGTVATGRVERGTIKVGEEVEIVGMSEDLRKTVVTGVEMFRKLLDQAVAGDNIGALLRGVGRDEIERGQVLAKPELLNLMSSLLPKYMCLPKKKVSTYSFFNGYRPQFYFRQLM